MIRVCKEQAEAFRAFNDPRNDKCAEVWFVSLCAEKSRAPMTVLKTLQQNRIKLIKSTRIPASSQPELNAASSYLPLHRESPDIPKSDKTQSRLELRDAVQVVHALLGGGPGGGP